MSKLKATLVGLTPLVFAGIAHAQDDLSTALSTEEAAEVTGAAAGGLAGLFAAGIVLAAIVGIIGLVFLGLWIWAMVDVIRRNFSDEKTKKTWMWLVILSYPAPVVISMIPGIGFLGSVLGLAGAVIVIVYLASIRKQGTMSGAKPATATDTKVEEKK